MHGTDAGRYASRAEAALLAAIVQKSMGKVGIMIQTELLKKIEQVLEEKVRPELGSHEGDIAIVGFEGGILKVRFLGKCSNCPSASLTLESTVASAVQEAVPEVKDVVLVTGVSDETWSMAKEILKKRREQRENRN